MKAITLQFPDLENLVAFQKTINSCAYEINFKHLTIYLICDDETTSEAMIYYNARVVSKQRVS